MGVRLHIPYRSLAGAELRSRSHVQFDKILSSIAAPPPPPSACGLVSFNWANNQLSGPFLGVEQNELFVVGCDALAQQRVVVFYSADYGETWALKDDVFPTLANVIGSMEARQDSSGNILVATQERISGRVSFSIFDPSSKAWTVLNSEVIASTGATDWYVSVDRRKNGDIAVIYDASPEIIVLMTWARLAFKYSTNNGASWSIENGIGHYGLPENDFLHRVIGGHAANTFTFVFTAGGNNLFYQPWSSGNVLGSIGTALTVINGPGLSGTAGRPVSYNDSGARLAIPEALVSFGTNVVIFSDTDPPVALGFGPIGGSLNCYQGQTALDFVDGDGLTIVAEVRNGFAPPQLDWCFWQSGGPGAWSPADQSLFIGPDIPLVGNFGHASGKTWTIEGQAYVGVVINIGTMGNENGFQFARASLLPVPPAHETRADWIAACTH
jgi:hypothetical protein